MRLQACVFLAVLLMSPLLSAQGVAPSADALPDGDRAASPAVDRASRLPELPAWSPSDYEGVKMGEIVPGESFFGLSTVDPEATIEPLVVDLPEDVEPQTVPEEDTVVSAEIMADYFLPGKEGRPVKSTFLVDPQNLLSRQEFRDRASFLNYHSDESGIDIVVYLFDAQQELPENYDIDKVLEDELKAHEPVALVYYHLGAPERAELRMSAEIRAVISQDEQDRALRAAITEAFEKTDEALQVDGFLIELSTRLYWIERELEIAGTQDQSAEVTLAEDAVLPENGDPEDSSQVFALSFLLSLGCVTICTGGWLVWSRIARRKKYYFPEVDEDRVFGAPHAGGVGAVVSFRDPQQPPSRQRNQEVSGTSIGSLNR